MKTKKVIIVGASGYSGVELANLLNRNSNYELLDLWVSKGSEYQGLSISQLYPQFNGILSHSFKAGDLDDILNAIPSYPAIDGVFFCTPHKVSHDWAQAFLNKGIAVFDLSGAFRLKNTAQYESHYGFEHESPELVAQAAYGLAEWNAEQIFAADLIAVAGCYPTAAGLSLKPLTHASLLNSSTKPVINAVSGVSGAGKNPTANTHFCEVSFSPYGLFNHRHQPEIAQSVGTDVVFTPHLGNFKRGIVMTTYAELKEGVTVENVTNAFKTQYDNKSLVRLVDAPPKVEQVVNTNYCDVYFQVQGNQIIIVAALDNLLKGAAGQAMQCANIHFGFNAVSGLVPKELEGNAFSSHALQSITGKTINLGKKVKGAIA